MQFEIAKSASDALHDAIKAKKPGKIRGARHANRMIAANVTSEEMAVVEKHARDGGYASIAEYVRAVAISPRAKFDTPYARIAKPLSDISYRIARCLDVLDRNETDAVRGYLHEMRDIIRAALLPLSREHDREVRNRE